MLLVNLRLHNIYCTLFLFNICYYALSSFIWVGLKAFVSLTGEDFLWAQSIPVHPLRQRILCKSREGATSERQTFPPFRSHESSNVSRQWGLRCCCTTCCFCFISTELKENTRSCLIIVLSWLVLTMENVWVVTSVLSQFKSCPNAEAFKMRMVVVFTWTDWLVWSHRLQLDLTWFVSC